MPPRFDEFLAHMIALYERARPYVQIYPLRIAETGKWLFVQGRFAETPR